MVSNIEFNPEQFNKFIEFVQKNLEIINNKLTASIQAGALMQARIGALETLMKGGGYPPLEKKTNKKKE